MQKDELRKQIIQILTKLSEQEKNQIEEKLRYNLFHSTLWKEAETIAITMSQGFEWNTKPIIEEGWMQGKVIAVPKCFPKEKELIFYRLHSFHELETVYYNLLEPKPTEKNRLSKSSLDLIIVPGIVYDSNGYRIGFGGGYYDRFLSSFNGETISILSEKQLVESVPSEAHDIAVRHLVIEEGFIK